MRMIKFKRGVLAAFLVVFTLFRILPSAFAASSNHFAVADNKSVDSDMVHEDYSGIAFERQGDVGIEAVIGTDGNEAKDIDETAHDETADKDAVDAVEEENADGGDTFADADQFTDPYAAAVDDFSLVSESQDDVGTETGNGVDSNISDTDRSASDVTKAEFIPSPLAGSKAGIGPNEYIYFPDTAFEAALKAAGIISGAGITPESAAAIIQMDLSYTDRDSPDLIQSLDGIEYFISLASLSCEYHSLTSINLSENIALKNLAVSGNRLTVLELSNNTSLEAVHCNENQLGSLTLPGTAALRELECYHNQLTAINLTGLSVLQRLKCHGNRLTILDLSDCPGVISLFCYENYMPADPAVAIIGFENLTLELFVFLPQRSAGQKKTNPKLKPEPESPVHSSGVAELSQFVSSVQDTNTDEKDMLSDAGEEDVTLSASEKGLLRSSLFYQAHLKYQINTKDLASLTENLPDIGNNNTVFQPASGNEGEDEIQQQNRDNPDGQNSDGSDSALAPSPSGTIVDIGGNNPLNQVTGVLIIICGIIIVLLLLFLRYYARQKK